MRGALCHLLTPPPPPPPLPTLLGLQLQAISHTIEQVEQLLMDIQLETLRKDTLNFKMQQQTALAKYLQPHAERFVSRPLATSSPKGMLVANTAASVQAPGHSFRNVNR